MNDVELVYMPYGALERPSLALSLLKVSLVEQGISCALRYATFGFAEEIGAVQYADMVWLRSEMVGEWTFAGAAFPDFHPDHEDYLSRVLSTYAPDGGEAAERITDLLWSFRRKAEAYVARVAREVVAGHPRIVACSSTFNQHTAVLALTRRVKELDPRITTILGGGNCEGEMGLSTARFFPWVDFVVSGEAEDIFAPLCRTILDNGRESAERELPFAVFGAPHRQNSGVWPKTSAVPRAVIDNLDSSPTPDFDDYFAAYARFGRRDLVTPGLLYESSRGCWWGMISHCTFCGLNGGSMAHKSKSADRVVAELTTLAGRYGVRRFLVVDNILDLSYFHSVLPRLADIPEKLTLFYEIKANVTYDQVRALAAAGVLWLQPGIESLHDDALKLMKKGTQSWINVQLLKWTRELGISTGWNVLCGFPGEEDGWYAEMAELVPLIEHLEPSTELRPIRFDRFSPYHDRPEEMGVTLQPAWPYAYIYPLAKEQLARLVYGFEAVDRPPQFTNPLRISGNEHFPSLGGPGRDLLQLRIRDWQRAFLAKLPPLLCMTESEDGRVQIFDTRSIAPQRNVTLDAVAARVYSMCHSALPLDTIVRDAATASPEEVVTAIGDLVERKLMARFGNRYLALALRGNVPSLPHSHRDGFPGGWVSRPRARRRAATPHPTTAVASSQLLAAIRSVTFDESLQLDSGRVIEKPVLAFETYGTLSPSRHNAILLCHPLTKGAHAGGGGGWWEPAIGPGRMFDTSRYFVICVSAIGGSGGSSGASSINPATGERYAMRFPVVTVADMARAQKRLLDHLGIARLHAVAGGCLGGQQALELAIREPDLCAHAIIIATTPATSAHTIAIFDVMQRLIRNDPDWRGGDYYDGTFPARGMGHALAAAVPLWMTRALMEERFGRRHVRQLAYDFAPLFEVEMHLERIASQQERRLDPNALLYLMRAMQYFDLEQEFGSLDAALSCVSARTLFVSYDSDWRYPSSEVQRLHDALTGAGGDSRHVVLSSSQGHGAFLVDVDNCAAAVEELFTTAALPMIANG